MYHTCKYTFTQNIPDIRGPSMACPIKSDVHMLHIQLSRGLCTAIAVWLRAPLLRPKSACGRTLCRISVPTELLLRFGVVDDHCSLAIRKKRC